MILVWNKAARIYTAIDVLGATCNVSRKSSLLPSDLLSSSPEISTAGAWHEGWLHNLEQAALILPRL